MIVESGSDRDGLLADFLDNTLDFVAVHARGCMRDAAADHWHAASESEQRDRTLYPLEL